MNLIPALSIRQPWAELLISGRKSIEIRAWTVGYRGLLWLHTGKKADQDLFGWFSLSDLFTGGYVGSVVVSAIVPLDRKRWELWRTKHLDPGEYRDGLYAWVMSSPRRFEQPIPGNGRLNLFYPPPELEKLLHRANSQI